ncbi:carboxypeptidase-like regulatory domain-containing protein [Phenylobacterium sp.]|uniref:carboxypeptidase-like regulatory domain-containing protein n=1 Tax=Phenylobacterium sp. TaxID=1871053 RepID=UPI0030F3700D
MKSSILAALGALALASLASAALAAEASNRDHIDQDAQRGVGKPVVVDVRDGAGRLARSAITDRNGAFTLKDLQPGPYQVTLSGEGMTRATVNSSGGTIAAERSFVVFQIGVLPPGGRAEPVATERLPLPGKSAAPGVTFKLLLPPPSSGPVNGIGGQGGGRYTFKPGQAFTYQGLVTFAPR